MRDELADQGAVRRTLRERIDALGSELSPRARIEAIKDAISCAATEPRADLDPILDTLCVQAEECPPVRVGNAVFSPGPLLEGLVARAAQGTTVRIQDVGTVQRIGDGVATLSGLPRARTDELIVFPTRVNGMVLNLDHGHVDVILLGSDKGIQGGDVVTGTGRRLRVPVGRRLLGRVVNALGEPLDTGGAIDPAEFRHLERPAPGIMDRQPVSVSLHTGVKMVDALVPIGRGQRELIIGDRQTGKTTLALDTIASQKSSGVLCVYVAIGQKKSSTLFVIEALQRAQAMDYTTVVVSSPDDPPALRYLAPYAGCAMAEFLMDEGNDVLVVFDDLTKHADAYRELSLLLRRPPGREAYPGDIFYAHARLLERSCRLTDEAGGGSLTALPIAETTAGNLASYIPTNIIAITDGQIVLDTDLFSRGIKPAINAGLSVSRVGGSAQSAAMRSIAGMLRLELAQYDEVSRFTRFGSEVDEVTQQQIRRGERLRAAFSQPPNAPLELAEEVLILSAANAGLLDDVPLADVPSFETGLLQYFRTREPDIFSELNGGGQPSPELQDALREAFRAFAEVRAGS